MARKNGYAPPPSMHILSGKSANGATITTTISKDTAPLPFLSTSQRLLRFDQYQLTRSLDKVLLIHDICHCYQYFARPFKWIASMGNHHVIEH